MLISLYDPKTKDIRVFSTDQAPAVLVLSAGELDSIVTGKDFTRAHFFLDARRVIGMAHSVDRAVLERRLKEAILNHPQWPEYSSAGALSAQNFNPTDMGGA